MKKENTFLRDRFEGQGMGEAEILIWGKEEDHERESGLCVDPYGSNSDEREKDRGASEEEEAAIVGELKALISSQEKRKIEDRSSPHPLFLDVI